MVYERVKIITKNIELPMPKHLEDKLRDPSSFVINPPVAIEWTTEPPKDIVNDVIAKSIGVISKSIGNTLGGAIKSVTVKSPPPPPPPTPLKPVDIVREVVNNPINKLLRTQDKIKPVIRAGEIEIPTEYEVQEVDYGDYAQG